MKKFINSESAVSESISFALTLGIIILSSALVYYAGAPIIEKSERVTHFQEMEKSFIFLLQNIDKVGYDKAPVRNTELKIKGGTLRQIHNSNITIGDITYDLGSIEYTYDEKTVAYEGGGIWTKYPPNGDVIMFSNPTFSIGNITTIPVIELIGEYEIGGEGNVRINSRLYDSSLNKIEPVNGIVFIEIKSDYYQGWWEYLNNLNYTGMINVNPPDHENQSVSANITADVVNVNHNIIQIQIPSY